MRGPVSVFKVDVAQQAMAAKWICLDQVGAASNSDDESEVFTRFHSWKV